MSTTDKQTNMTAEEAIKTLKGEAWICCSEKWNEALGMAIEALKTKPCEDAVSRQTVKEQMIKYGFLAPDMTVTEFVEDLSPVSPWKSKIGHWFIDERPESDREVICSNCDQPILKYHKLDFDYRPNYCPNCGAKMVEPAESEEQT